MESLFYLCTQEGCKRKYKTAVKWVNHLTKDHGVENPALPDPVPYDRKKNNKKNIIVFYKTDTERSRRQREIEPVVRARRQREIEAVERAKRQREIEEEAARHQRELEEEAARRQREIEEEAIREAEVQLRERYGQEYIKLEEEKMRIVQRVKDNPDECCICYDAPADTAVIPCGHKYFCHPCILNQKTNYSQQGCPFCRGPIFDILKVYEQ